MREPPLSRKWYHKIRLRRRGCEPPISRILGNENEQACEQLW
jgi:hypothetical protein